MSKISITDESGDFVGHFSPEKATKFEEATWWNGNNHISKATKDKFSHQALYLTAKKKWVLNSWSQWQGTIERYELIPESAAINWLMENEEWEWVEEHAPKALQTKEL